MTDPLPEVDGLASKDQVCEHDFVCLECGASLDDFQQPLGWMTEGGEAFIEHRLKLERPEDFVRFTIPVSRVPAAANEEPAEQAPSKEQTEHAIHIAKLWRAGKMIGGDEDDVRNTLLGEIERLEQCHREGWRHAAEVEDEYERRMGHRFGTPHKPAHEREAPHCSTCSCPPYESKLTYSQACDLLARYAIALQDRQCCGDEMQSAYMAALKACTDAMGVTPPTTGDEQ